MNVLLTGATGFIGCRLLHALTRTGHSIIGVGRSSSRSATTAALRHVRLDYAQATDPADWLPHLNGIDAVINAVGIFRERGAQTFETIHTRAPKALFDACLKAGVRKVVQISALGADENARSRYHLSKRAADEHLARLDLDWVIVQPSLVYGGGGASAKFFNTLASLPAIPVPGRGEQRVQPVHVDDVAAAILALLRPGAPSRARIALVGPEPLSLRAWLQQLRVALGMRAAPVLAVPMPLVRVAARAGEHLPGALLTAEALDMLARGNTASAAPITALLGHPPRPASQFVAPEEAAEARHAARWRWLRPLLTGSIGIVWLWSGLVSLGIYPVEDSYALLAGVGATGLLAGLLLYGAALLDIALGIATLALRRRAGLWKFQIGLILGYSAIIAWALPEFWLHPFGPVIKNLPMLAALVILLATEDEWTTW